MNEEQILRELRALREKDLSYESGRILSAVSSKPLPVAIEAYKIFSDVNSLDTHVFNSVRHLEAEVISWLGKLLHNKNASGYVTTGGTEANIAALWVARKLNPHRRKVVAPESVHYSIMKAVDLMGLELELVPLDEYFRANVSVMKEKIDEGTVAVIATAGTSALGVVDPIEEIGELCEDTFLHVDAAFGGFVLPFIENPKKFDFLVDSVDSITIDPHKMGLAPLPSGAILFRDESYTKKIIQAPTYLPNKSFTVSGSRSGGALAATWAVIKSLDTEGYRKVVSECMENTRFLCKELRRINVPPLIEPELNFVAIRPPKIQKTLDSLRKRGWNIILDAQTQSMRIVVMPHVTKKVIQSFISDLEDLI